MGTTVQIVVADLAAAPPVEIDHALQDVEMLFVRLERRLSRFLPASELSRVSLTLAAVLADALRLASEKDGAFDPTVLPAVLAVGYDRSFELLAADGSGGSSCAGRAAKAGGAGGAARRRCSWRDVDLRAPRRGHRALVSLPPGCALDLGGIGNGWAVDRAAARLRRAGFAHFAIDAGGDVYAAGNAEDGAPWTVGVEDPRDPAHDILVLAVRDGAVATLTTARRRRRRGPRRSPRPPSSGARGTGCVSSKRRRRRRGCSSSTAVAWP